MKEGRVTILRKWLKKIYDNNELLVGLTDCIFLLFISTTIWREYYDDVLLLDVAYVLTMVVSFVLVDAVVRKICPKPSKIRIWVYGVVVAICGITGWIIMIRMKLR